MVGWILLILFLMLIIGFLLIPINIGIDSIKKQYFVQLKGLAKASIERHDEELMRIKLQVPFKNFYFYPLREVYNTKPKKEKPKSRKPSKRRMSFRTISRLLKSFKVKRFAVDIDTGNSILNAKLYPAFAFLRYRFGNFNINFEGRNQMVLYLHNRPIYILKSFINI